MSFKHLEQVHPLALPVCPLEDCKGGILDWSEVSRRKATIHTDVCEDWTVRPFASLSGLNLKNNTCCQAFIELFQGRKDTGERVSSTTISVSAKYLLLFSGQRIIVLENLIL